MTFDLTQYDAILVNTSAGKDSQAMMDVLVKMAREQGCTDKLIAVHADLGRVEWTGTKELAEEQAKFYGIRFEIVKRKQGDLLENVIQKHASIVKRDKRSAKTGELQVSWPDPQNRWCTSEHKTAQVSRLMTQVVDEVSVKLWGRKFNKGSDMPRPVRILTCLGIRSNESDKRGDRVAVMVAKNGMAIEYGTSASNGKRTVDEWFPIADWTWEQVWACIDASGAPYHPAYDMKPGDHKGSSRLSCCFCMMASKRDLVLAAQRNPELAQEYVKVEQVTGKTFAMNMSMTELVALAASPKAWEILSQADTEESSFECCAA